MIIKLSLTAQGLGNQSSSIISTKKNNQEIKVYHVLFPADVEHRRNKKSSPKISHEAQASRADMWILHPKAPSRAISTSDVQKQERESLKQRISTVPQLTNSSDDEKIVRHNWVRKSKSWNRLQEAGEAWW